MLPVVLYHAGLAGFSGGFVGVDIFFVISGYLITGIIWRDLQEGRFSLGGFYARRIRRIFPALCVTLAVSSVAAYFLLIPRDLISFGKSLNATILFFQNFNLLKDAGYFEAPAIDKPLLHTWSLSVEEQFYAIWPLLLVLAAWLLPPKRVLPAVLALAGLSLLLAQLKLDGHPKDAFYVSYYRMWELLVGAALALAPPLLFSRRGAPFMGACGLAAIIFAIVFYDSSTPFPALTALLPCLGAALIIGAGEYKNPVSSLLSLGAFRFFGLISYSLYLVHWPLFSFAHLYVSGALSPELRLFIVLASIVLAYLSWRYVEMPFRRASSSNAVAVFRGMAVAGMLALAGVVFVLNAGFPSRANEAVLAAEHVAIDLGEAGYEKYCRPVPIEGVRGANVCALGQPSPGGYDFVLWGDSHAYHYVPAISALAERNRVSGIVFAFPGCAPFAGDTSVPRDCQNFNAAVLDWLSRQKPPELVLLASRWTVHRQDIERAVQRPGSGGLDQTLTALDKLKVKTVVLGQVPEYVNSVPLCVARAIFHGRQAGACTAQPLESFQKHYRFTDNYFRSLQRLHDFAVASPIPAFCNEVECKAISGADILMIDDNHLSEAGALYLTRYLNIPGLPYGWTETSAARVSDGDALREQMGTAAGVPGIR